MATTILTKQSVNKEILFYFLNAFLITNVLFYMDEGHNDFQWMSNAINWIVFAIYTIIIFGIQLLFSQVIFREVNRQNRRISIITLGTIGTIFLLAFNLFVQ